MQYNELAAIFIKVARKLDSIVNWALIKLWECENFWWDLSTHSHRRLRECQQMVERANFYAGKLVAIWKLMGVSFLGCDIPNSILGIIFDFVNPSFEVCKIERLNKDFKTFIADKTIN